MGWCGRQLLTTVVSSRVITASNSGHILLASLYHKKKKKNPSILLQHSVSVLQWAGVTSAWLGIVQLPEFVQVMWGMAAAQERQIHLVLQCLLRWLPWPGPKLRSMSTCLLLVAQRDVTTPPLATTDSLCTVLQYFMSCSSWFSYITS